MLERKTNTHISHVYTHISSVKEDRDDILVYKSIEQDKIIKSNCKDISIFYANRDEAVAILLEQLESKERKKLYISLLTPRKILYFLKQKDLSLLKENMICFAATNRMRWFAQDTKHKQHVLPMVFFMDMMHLSNKYSFTVYFISNNDIMIQRVVQIIKRGFPHVRCIGVQNIRKKERVQLILKNLKKSAPHIVFIDVDFVKQTNWLESHWQQLPNSIFIGMENSYATLTGMSYLPRFMQRVGLKWLWDAFTAPWRMFSFLLIVKYYFSRKLSSFSKK